MKATFILLSGLITIIAAAPFIVETARGSAKPKLVSWLIWAALLAIGSLSAANSGQIPAANYTLFCCLECLLVAVLGFRFGDSSFDRLDIICLFGAVIGLAALILLRSSVFATVIVIATDLLAALPTVKHAWAKPREESWSSYALFGTGGLLSLFVANFHDFTAVAYPLYLVLLDFGLVYCIKASPNRLPIPADNAAATVKSSPNQAVFVGPGSTYQPPVPGTPAYSSSPSVRSWSPRRPNTVTGWRLP